MKNSVNLWKKKSVIIDFAIADLKVRYRNSVLGFLWTILEPLLLMGVLYVVFTNVFQSDIENFPLYLLLGLILWNMFQRATLMGLKSIESRAGILSQIYIPTEIPAISASITSLIMVSFEMIVFGIFLAIFQFIPTWTIIFLPLVILLEFVVILGVTLPLSVLNIKFKDIEFVWNVVIYAGFFLHPIFYKTEILPVIAQNILRYDPMVQILNFARDLVLYDTIPSIENIMIGVGMSFLVLGIGYGIFKKVSKRIMEEV